MKTSLLKNGFEQLKLTARRLDDIQEWFKQNPAVFSGPLRSFNRQAEDVELEIDPDTIVSHLVDTESLLVTVRIWMLAQWDLDPVLDDVIQLSEDDAETAQQQEYRMHLKFADWPLATGILVGTYFVESWYTSTAPHAVTFKKQLDNWMGTHFPGMSLDKLQKLHNADLLVPENDPGLGVHNIIDLLFTARENKVHGSLPTDIAPYND